MGSFSVNEKSPGVMALVRSGCDAVYPSLIHNNSKEAQKVMYDKEIETEMMSSYAEFLASLQSSIELHQKIADAAFVVSFADSEASGHLVNSFQCFADGVQALASAIRHYAEAHYPE
jgi:hypothetical protein